jgi:signal transduction histidine kinase
MRSPSEMANIINERTAALEASNKSLQKLNLDLDNYVYAASHNLKSPITNMEGLLTLIQEEVEVGNLPDKILLENMQVSMQRVRSTIQTLTSIIQLEKNPYDDIEFIHLPTLLKELLSENEMMMKQHHVKVITHFEILSIEYSLLGMKSILQNLISNSIKYSHPDRSPLIEIRAYINKEEKKCISIKDNGLGIDLERNKENIFKLFKRFHTHVEGSGIGLYSIKQLIERKNGTIEVMSTLNQGTEFIVTF